MSRSRLALGSCAALLASALVANAHAAAPAKADAVAQAEPDPSCAETTWSEGSKDAEVSLRLWIDPFTNASVGGNESQFAYDAWLGLRDILVDRGAAHSFRLEIAVARRRTGGMDSSPEARQARLIFMALLEQAGPNALLRAMTRSAGYDLELATHREDAQRKLAKSVGIELSALDLSEARRHCREEQLEAGRAYLDAQMGSRSGGFPVIEMRAAGHRPRFVQDANSRSGEVRALLDELTSPSPGGAGGLFELPAGPRSLSPAPELARTYPGYGVLIGGPGLHHHLLVLADDERSSVLTRSLPALLAFISQRPGELSVQVLGVGSGPHAETFARRLCAARHAGMELPYLRYLSWNEARREQLDPELGERLDAIAEREACPNSELPELQTQDDGPDAKSRRGRRGGTLSALLQSRDLWLDGMPSTTSEVERLAMLLAAAPAQPGLWQLMWTPYEVEE